MSDYGITDILRDVRTVMDMNGTDMQLIEISSTDTLSIDDIIRSNIETAAKDVELAAPARLLGEGKDMKALRPTWEKRGSLSMAYVELPSDFLRLISVKMSSWRKQVTNAIAEDDTLYDILDSSYGGITGNPEQPVAAIVTGNTGGQGLELYSSESEQDTIEKGRYLPVPKIKGTGAYNTISFSGIVTLSSIENVGFDGPYNAFYETNRKRFVFQKAGVVVVPQYYISCTEEYKYNESGSVRKDVSFLETKTSDLYRYSKDTGGLVKFGTVGGESIDIPEQLYNDVIRRTAYLSYLTLGDNDGAARMSGGSAQE